MKITKYLCGLLLICACAHADGPPNPKTITRRDTYLSQVLNRHVQPKPDRYGWWWVYIEDNSGTSITRYNGPVRAEYGHHKNPKGDFHLSVYDDANWRVDASSPKWLPVDEWVKHHTKKGGQLYVIYVGKDPFHEASCCKPVIP